MGGLLSVCDSSLDEDLLPATDEDIQVLKDRGHLPCIATPTIDFQDKNHLQSIYVALYENGTELTLLFLDEDRPNACEDCLYDTIRRPLFGRFSDIETIFMMNDGTVEFPGTYSGSQTWNTTNPTHEKATLNLSAFEKHKETNQPILWINTWNHLIGEKNNNSTMPITYQTFSSPQAIGGEQENNPEKAQDAQYDFVIRRGSRNEVDDRFKGIMTSVSKVMTNERKERLGKRL